MALVDLSDVRLHYELRGHGPAILLISGLGQTASGWDPIVPQLAQKFSVIQADNRGIGQSVARKTARRMEDHASDFVELLDVLQVDEAHVVGLSFGGLIAQRLAADHPSRVNRLVLISTTDRTYPYLGQIGNLLAHALRHFPVALFFQTVELLGTSPPYFDSHIAEILESVPLRSAQRGSRRVLANQLRCINHAANGPQRGVIIAPTLVLAGEYDALIPNCYGQRLAAGLPDGQFRMMNGCGHNPVIEQPEIVGGIIERFLLGMEAQIELKGPRQPTGRDLELVEN
ncbi:MAG: alpha/beta hydrolase [Planctomycetota bacterium]|nr:alpha/beta hydrolase [Planctomycetota bacterium]